MVLKGRHVNFAVSYMEKNVRAKIMCSDGRQRGCQVWKKGRLSWASCGFSEKHKSDMAAHGPRQGNVPTLNLAPKM